MKYLIDSNCFIEPHRGVCPLDVAISFWKKLKEMTSERDVYVLDRVKGELSECDDQLNVWIRDNVGKQVLKFESDETVRKFREVNIWAISNEQYTQKAKDKFRLYNVSCEIRVSKVGDWIFIVIIVILVIGQNAVKS